MIQARCRHCGTPRAPASPWGPAVGSGAISLKVEGETPETGILTELFTQEKRIYLSTKSIEYSLKGPQIAVVSISLFQYSMHSLIGTTGLAFFSSCSGFDGGAGG